MSFVKKYPQETQVWLMSDLHLNHTQKFIYETRGFKTIEEHNETIIKNIKECVKENDEFYILGDLALGPLGDSIELLKQIPGHVHIILGNHDTERRIEFYQSLGWDIQFAAVIRWHKYRFYLSHYPTCCENEGEDKITLATISISGHTHQKIAWSSKSPFSYCVCPEANGSRPVAINDIVATISMGKTFNKKGE